MENNKPTPRKKKPSIADLIAKCNHLDKRLKAAEKKIEKQGKEIIELRLAHNRYAI